MTPIGEEVFAMLSLSLLPIVVAIWVFTLAMRNRDGEAASRYLARSVVVIGVAAFLAALFHMIAPQLMPPVTAWEGKGLHLRAELPADIERRPVDPASREERERGLKALWNAIDRSLAGKVPPETRDELASIAPDSWVVPGEGGPTFRYIVDRVGFVTAEPYQIDGEQLATRDGSSIEQVSEDVKTAIWMGQGL